MDTPPSASAGKPKALFLSPEAPYPMIGGGPLRSASLLEYLLRHYSVHVIVFHQNGDPDPMQAMPVERLEKLDVLELPHHSKHALARAARNSVRMFRQRPPLLDRFSGFSEEIAQLVAGREYETAIIEHFWCAPHVEQLRPRSRRVILDLHNIESEWHRRLAAFEAPAKAFALRRFATASVVLERKWLPAFDRLLVASEQDAEVARGIVPSANVTVYPNALPELPPPPRQERDEIVFSGNLEYAPNIMAVRYFHDHIWPSLRSRWPALKWKIVGKNPEAVRNIVHRDPRIELTGFVEDAIAFLSTAKVAVVPVLAGSGTRVKILEAWAAGTAVVSTTLGAEGLECRDGEHLLLADSPYGFSEVVSKLLDSEERRHQIAAAARKLYDERFTWPAAWQRLECMFGNDVGLRSV